MLNAVHHLHTGTATALTRAKYSEASVTRNAHCTVLKVFVGLMMAAALQLTIYHLQTSSYATVNTASTDT